MRIPFDISKRPQIESGEYKVETRDGRPARIICWDVISDAPIVALVAGIPSDKTDTREYILSCFEKGNYFHTKECENDLFIVTPEPKMSEWELAIAKYRPPTDSKETIQRIAAELLSLAKQQFLQSGELLTQEHHEKLMETLREECKKDLPRWKKFNLHDPYNGSAFRIFADFGGEVYISTDLTDFGKYPTHYIDYKELRQLPKEEDHDMSRAEDWTTYDAHGRVVSKNRDSRLSQALLEEVTKEANRIFNKLVKKGIYKEDEFEKFCIEYYLEEKHHE